MRHINHSKENLFDTAILIKDMALRQQPIEDTYLKPLEQLGTSTDKSVSFSLDYGGTKKPKVSVQKTYLNQLLPEIDKLGIKDLLVCDGEYFKTLTGERKAEPHYGYVLPCKLKGYEHLNIVLCPNHQALFYNPDLKDKVSMALKTLHNHKSGNYTQIGTGIIHTEYYPSTLDSISTALDSLHKYPMLTCDIEAFSLKHYTAGIGTIGFAWDQHNGLAFNCDYKPLVEPVVINKSTSIYAEQVRNEEIRELLRNFFKNYKGKIIWHNLSFDTTVLVYQLFMENIIDHKGLIDGIHIMCNKVHDTKIISYLATNSCAGNHLSLKDQAHEFAGNYAESEIKDIRKIRPDKLLRYNLVDCLSTWYVYNKNEPVMVRDQQKDIYENLMLPSLKTIVQMQLTGMCMDMNKVEEAEQNLTDIHTDHLLEMMQLPFVQQFETTLRQRKIDSDNRVLKTKKRTMADVLDIKFNPNSNPQLQELIYAVMGLPKTDFTMNRQPSTSGKTIKKLINRATVPDHKKFLENLLGYIKVDKILSAFIPTFKAAPLAPDGYHYLFGNFNLDYRAS